MSESLLHCRARRPLWDTLYKILDKQPSSPGFPVAQCQATSIAVESIILLFQFVFTGQEYIVFLHANLLYTFVAAIDLNAAANSHIHCIINLSGA